MSYFLLTSLFFNLIIVIFNFEIKVYNYEIKNNYEKNEVNQNFDKSKF